MTKPPTMLKPPPPPPKRYLREGAPPTTQRINDFPRNPVWWILLMICGPIVAFMLLFGWLYENPCPVRTGDRVIGHGGAGEVRMIYQAGSASKQCKAGVRWDSGETEAVEGWRLEVVDVAD